MTELIAATRNRHKTLEIQDILGLDFRVRDLGAHPEVSEIRESGKSLDENAKLKALAASEQLPGFVIADDSGLEVFGLDGRPGVHSARWAGPGRDFSAAMARVRDELIGRSGSLEAAERGAAFTAVLCLAWPDGHEEIAEGRVPGHIVDPPRGSELMMESHEGELIAIPRGDERQWRSHEPLGPRVHETDLATAPPDKEIGISVAKRKRSPSTPVQGARRLDEHPRKAEIGTHALEQ